MSEFLLPDKPRKSPAQVMCFKENFVRLCNSVNKTPSSVCCAVGITPAAFTQWTEKTIPRRATLIKIADYFGVTPESLLEDEQKKDPAHLSREEKIAYILTKYAAMSDTERQELENYADYLLSKRSK